MRVDRFGKTKLLTELNKHSLTLDLEDMAKLRLTSRSIPISYSSSQKQFESNLLVAMLRLNAETLFYRIKAEKLETDKFLRQLSKKCGTRNVCGYR